MKHKALSMMLARAKQWGKAVVSRDQLEAMVPLDMRCPACSREMTWKRSEGGGRTATLQHDRGGSIRILCSTCNTRHARLPGDMFYELPPDQKYCRGCAQKLPRSAFPVDARRPGVQRSRCRECENGDSRRRYRLKRPNAVARETSPFVLERD